MHLHPSHINGPILHPFQYFLENKSYNKYLIAFEKKQTELEAFN